MFKEKPQPPGAHAPESLWRAAEPKYDSQNVGSRLRAMRIAKGLSVNALAAISQVPASTISKMENGRLQPSLVHAINLAMALRENLGFLVGSFRAEPEDIVVVSCNDRSKIDYPELGLALEDLNGNFHSGVLEARMNILRPGATSGEQPMMHVGDELCYVLTGAVQYDIDGESYELNQGDTIHFKSDQMHSWKNIHEGCTTLLMVFSNDLSF